MRKLVLILKLLPFLAFMNAHALAATPVKAVVSAPAVSNVLLEMNGNIYPQDSFPGACKDLFKGVKCQEASYGHYHVESVREENGEVYSKCAFSGPEGDQVLEQSWEKNGHVRKAIIENRALGKKSELEVINGKVFYSVTDKEGVVKKSEEKLEENLVVPSTVMAYVRPFFPSLMKGEDVQLNVAVLDRKESFHFNMKRERVEKGLDGEDILVMKMEPANFVIKALINPMYFYVKPKTGEMFAFEGRSSLRRKVDGQYKEMDVRAAYQYKVNAYSEQASAQKSSCSTGDFKLNNMKCDIKGETNEIKTSVQN